MKISLNYLSRALLSLRLVLEKHTIMQLNLKLINTNAAHLVIAHHLPTRAHKVCPHYWRRKITNPTTAPNKLQGFQLSTRATNEQALFRVPSHSPGPHPATTQVKVVPQPARSSLGQDLPGRVKPRHSIAGVFPFARPRARAHLRQGPAPLGPGPGPGPTGRESKDRAVVTREGEHARCWVVLSVKPLKAGASAGSGQWAAGSPRLLPEARREGRGRRVT